MNILIEKSDEAMRKTKTKKISKRQFLDLTFKLKNIPIF
jgi:hypothetical protein